MLRNYLKIALRNLVKNKVYLFINIGGLAFGMAVDMLIGLWIYDELSFNKYHQNYDHIAQIMQNQNENGEIHTWKMIPYPYINEIKTNLGAMKHHLFLQLWGSRGGLFGRFCTGFCSCILFVAIFQYSF